MPSYRFCRPDDIPYLARAIEECFDVHFPGAPAMTEARYRAEMKALDVWPSNSMVASSGDGPIAVLIGTKRDHEVLVQRVGVRPDHRRRGHGLHLVTSLSQKLAVLGPERLVAEVPRSLDGVGDFFRAAGYRLETTFTDYLLGPAPVEPPPEDLIAPVTVADLADDDLLAVGNDVAWERRLETLANRGDELTGLAVVTPERVEACAFSRIPDDEEAVEVVALRARESRQRQLFFELLLRAVAAATRLPIRLPRLAEGEVPDEVLAELGFAPTEIYDRVAATATPA